MRGSRPHPPASSNSTRTSASSLSLPASVQPADPAPTVMYSQLSGRCIALLRLVPSANGRKHVTGQPARQSEDERLRFEGRRYGHVIGRPRPAARLACNFDPAETVAQRRADPDVIKPPSFVGSGPVRRAIAPPGIELGRFRDDRAGNVDPAAGALEGRELFTFDRRVRHDLEQLLMAPDVVLERRNVEITDHDRARVARPQIGTADELVQEAELVREFWIDFGVRLVAARRHIEIVHLDRLAQAGFLSENDRDVT